MKNPASGNPAIQAEGAEIVRICSGFSFTEGPAADQKGNVFFTDQPNNKIYKWSLKNKLSVFHDSAQRSNGLYFREDGKLLACADEQYRLIELDRKGRISVLAGEYNGKPFNGPNDLWIDLSGRIYFTDPYYQRPWWTRQAPEQDCEGVYCLEPSGRLSRVADDFKKPNGIIGTPDGKTLYVADIGAWRIYRYNILPDGSLSGKKWFAPEGSDGMTLDEKGNVYLTNSAVSVYSPAGLKIASIPAPEMPSNACFGGKDRKTLFITARTSVYTLKMKVRGI
ncbi:SMP-30/gluconolactonase/LRE family protein [bacterium]|nr:SMP-30/gluconolactonase/LRE family protein [bacterium]